jgi:hypothetical protein
MKSKIKTFVLICLLSTSLALPAEAADLPDVVRVLFDNWKTQSQIEPTYDSINDDGSGNIIINKLSVAKAPGDGNPGMKMTIDEIGLMGVSDEGNGLYAIDTASFTGINMALVDSAGAAFTVSMPKGSVESWYVKDPGDSPAPETALRASMNVARKMSSGPITIETMGHTITSDGYVSTWDGDPITGAGNFTGKLANVVIPESALTQIDPSGSLKQLGYSSLTFDIEGDGKMDIAQDKIGLSFNFAYIGKDMGALRFSVGANDIPIGVYGELQNARAAGKEPDFAALMPELQNVLLSGLTLRFEDNSITKKVLPMAAAMQGMDEAAMVANAGAMLQLGLTQLNNQVFTDQAVSAVNSFLKNPGSITIEVKPAAPIKVQELMTLNPAAPGEAITKLGVSVTAND